MFLKIFKQKISLDDIKYFKYIITPQVEHVI